MFLAKFLFKINHFIKNESQLIKYVIAKVPHLTQDTNKKVTNSQLDSKSL